MAKAVETETAFYGSVTDIKEAFKANRERELNIPDGTLALVLDKLGSKQFEAWQNDEDEGEELLIKFLEKAEKEVAKVSVADPAISAIVKRLDPTFLAELDACVEGVKKGKTSAVDIYAQFRRIFPKEEMNGWPMPGTDEKTVTGNYRADKVKKTTGNGDEITTVWSNDLADSTPHGKLACDIIADVSKERNATNSTRFKGKKDRELFELVDDATADRNAIRAIVRRAVTLHHAWEAVEGMPQVGISWQKAQGEKYITMPENFGTGKAGTRPIKVSRNPKPIWIFPADDPSNGKRFSVTQLNNFDVAAALAAGGTMSDLTATLKGGADNDRNDDEGDGVDMGVDGAYTAASRFHNFANKKENKADILRILADKKHDEHKDWVQLIGDNYLAYRDLFRKCRAEYEAINETKIADNEKEAAA